MRTRCQGCGQMKPMDDYYISEGHRRLKCKACIIKVNSAYQKKRKPWKSKDIDSKRTYSREYYAQNKDKFVIYRKNFLERHPDYFRNRRQGS